MQKRITTRNAMARSPLFSLGIIAIIAASTEGCLGDLKTTPNQGGAGGEGMAGNGAMGGTGGTIIASTSSSSSSSSSSNSGGTGGMTSSSGTAGAGGMVNTCNVGFSCAAAPPAGWEGYARVQSLAYTTDPPPTCPDGSVATVYYAEPATMAECSSCACSFSGASCSAPKVECFWSVGCPGTPDFTDQSNDETCIGDMPGATNSSSCRIAAPPNRLSKGTCAAAGGVLLNEPFAKRINVCPIPSGSACGQNGQCLPTDPGVFNPEVCVLRTGSDACPAGFDIEVQVFGSNTDKRKCSECTCDTNAVTCTGGSYLVHEGDGCDGGIRTVSAIGTCVGVGTYLDGGTGSLRPKKGTPVDGTCGGGVGSGSVQGESPRKLCCMKFD